MKNQPPYDPEMEAEEKRQREEEKRRRGMAGWGNTTQAPMTPITGQPISGGGGQSCG
jgi:hypothetical protein